MLKERINFLLEKKGMSRKELVSGLITLPHFSNILKGRYILAEDLASKFALKLGVTADYLLKAEDVSNHILKGANDIVNQMIVSIDVDKTYVTTLPNYSNSFVIELTSRLMSACYYQSIEDHKNYASLHKDYLNFYLKAFSDDKIKELPSPLKKAFYFYKIQVFKSKNDFELAYQYCILLLPLLAEDVEPFLAVKKIEVEILLTLGKFEVAKKSLDEAIQQIQLKNLNHHLPSFYVLQSSYYFYLGFLDEALICLSKAEENIVHLDTQVKGSYLITIFNNRIVMLIKAKKLVEAEAESDRFNAFLQQSSEVQDAFFTLIKIYKADIALLGKQFDQLALLIEDIEKSPKNRDQRYALRFYKAMLAITNGDYQTAEQEAETAVTYFEANPIIERLVPLYETLGICAEKKRQYKKSSDMYKKIVYLLKES